MNRPPAREAGIADRLLAWFTAAMRPLPWRETYEPYSVWISEIMLQQTQMDRGVAYFNAWMRRFPDVRSVAEAKEEAIMAAWEGLGYYSRAKNLQAAARRIMREHRGVFPRDIEAIRALPGVGEYTAGAIASIAFNQPEPAVDANVLRIFARLRDIDAPMKDKKVKAFVTDTVRSLIPAGSSRLFCQALMELGALVCAKRPKCGACPLRDYCAALQNGTTAERPRLDGKKNYTQHEIAAGIVRRNGRVFIQKRPPGGLWAGLWEFPNRAVAPDESPEQTALRAVREQTGLAASVREKIAIVRHGYTTNRVILHGFFCEAAEGDEACPAAVESAWASPEELAGYAFSAGHRKLLERLGWKTGR